MAKEYMVDFDKRIEKYREKLQKSDTISENNKQDIEDFLDEYCTGKNLSLPTQLKHLKTLMQLATVLGRDFRGVMENNDKKAITKLINKLSKMNINKHILYFGNKPKRAKRGIRHYSEATMYEFRKELRCFFRWLNDGEQVPICVKHIKLGKKPEKKILPQQLITYNEYKRIVDAAETIRDRAIISCHLESGARAGEFVPIRIKQVTYEGVGYRIDTDGKTGPRKFLLVESVPYLRQWLSSHPNKDNQESYLWITKPINKPEDLTNFKNRYITRLRKICQKAGIKKHIWFHLGRHSQTTIMLKAGVPEKIIEKQMGWKPGSTMINRYLHLSTKDVDEALARRFGISMGEKQPEHGAQCPVCDYINPIRIKDFCGMCGAVLNVVAAQQAESKLKYEKLGTHLLDKLLKSARVRRMVEKLIDKGELKEEDLPTYKCVKSVRIKEKTKKGWFNTS